MNQQQDSIQTCDEHCDAGVDATEKALARTLFGRRLCFRLRGASVTAEESKNERDEIEH